MDILYSPPHFSLGASSPPSSGLDEKTEFLDHCPLDLSSDEWWAGDDGDCDDDDDDLTDSYSSDFSSSSHGGAGVASPVLPEQRISSFSLTSTSLVAAADKVTATREHGGQAKIGLSRRLQVPLGKDFVPGDWDVICGRGKQSFDHIGNRRFRILVATRLRRYNEGSTRASKTAVVVSIVNQVRDASPQGGFIRRDAKTGMWYEVGTRAAREKVGHTIRDALAEPLRRKPKTAMIDRRLSVGNAIDEIFRVTLTPSAAAPEEGKKNKRRRTLSTILVHSDTACTWSTLSWSTLQLPRILTGTKIAQFHLVNPLFSIYSQGE